MGEQLGQPEHRLGDAEPLTHAVAVRTHRPVDRAAERRHIKSLIDRGLLQGATGGRPVGMQVLPTGEVRQEARALDQGADAAQRGCPGPHRAPAQIDSPGVGGDEPHRHA